MGSVLMLMKELERKHIVNDNNAVKIAIIVY